MGIDIGFTDESLAQCKYAKCAPYRRNIVALYSEVPNDGADPFADYRDQDVFVNMAAVKAEEPTLYSAVSNELHRFNEPELWHWNQAWFGSVYKDRKMRRKLKPYIETKPSSRVLLRKMPKELAEEWKQKADDDSVLSAWWQMPYEKHVEICKPCPIRPLDEWNCYLRFSNYPSMDIFREGFMLTVLYASTIDEEKLKHAYFSFPHIDRNKGELPKDKLARLYEMCRGTEINKEPEVFFNKVFDMLSQAIPDDHDLDSNRLDLKTIPFVDEFLSKFIYREEPYSVQEAREVLPYFEIMKEVADWAIWDADRDTTRKAIISFEDRLDRLVTALKLADKYEIEPYVSY